MTDHPCGTSTTSVEFEELLIAHQRPLLHYIKSLVANHHEAEDLLQRVDRKDHESWPVFDPAAGVDDGALLHALKDCLGKLPSRDQELLFVRYATNRPLKEYAENLSRRPGTLKARLFQIRENLKKSIEARLREGEPGMAGR
jgi:DNA-directed RNA polymerase specialized sigma24 family protein